MVFDKDATVSLVNPAGAVVSSTDGLPYRFEVDLKVAAGNITVTNLATRQQTMKKWSLVLGPDGVVRSVR